MQMKQPQVATPAIHRTQTIFQHFVALLAMAEPVREKDEKGSIFDHKD